MRFAFSLAAFLAALAYVGWKVRGAIRAGRASSSGSSST